MKIKKAIECYLKPELDTDILLNYGFEKKGNIYYRHPVKFLCKTRKFKLKERHFCCLTDLFNAGVIKQVIHYEGCPSKDKICYGNERPFTILNSTILYRKNMQLIRKKL